MIKAYKIAEQILPQPSIYLGARLEGQCAKGALLLSHALLRHGIDHEIVIWRLDMTHPENRERFLDHWAVAVDFPFIIDPTYPQVKGDLRYFVDARYDYPEYYGQPERYPAQAIMDAGGLAFIEGVAEGNQQKIRAGVHSILTALNLWFTPPIGRP